MGDWRSGKATAVGCIVGEKKKEERERERKVKRVKTAACTQSN